MKSCDGNEGENDFVRKPRKSLHHEGVSSYLHIKLFLNPFSQSSEIRIIYSKLSECVEEGDQSTPQGWGGGCGGSEIRITSFFCAPILPWRLRLQRSLWSAKLNTQHVPLRQSVEDKERGKGQEEVWIGENVWIEEVVSGKGISTWSRFRQNQTNRSLKISQATVETDPICTRFLREIETDPICTRFLRQFSNQADASRILKHLPQGLKLASKGGYIVMD